VAFKLWTSGELLTSADLNLYLAQQAVIRCTSGTRPSSPNEGMLVYETDTDRYSSYNGGWLTLGQNVTATYTPALTATSNPNLGTGGTAEGRYTLFNGKWCTVRVTFQWGTSGTAGSGQYLISLPVNTSASITNGVSNVGSAMLRDASGGPALNVAVCYATASASTMALLSVGGGLVNNTTPWAWGGSGDYITATLTYETV
jgi:hypothetical protein